MKKLAIRSLVLLAWSMNLASCTSDDVRENNSVTPDAKGLIPVEIRSGINGGRTELNNDGKTVVFQANDSLAVWDGQGDQEIRRFGTKDGGSVAIFKGSLDENASNLNILYPLQDGATCNSGTITATIPATQKATAGTFDPRANLSVATADYVKGQNVTCTLENVCGVLKFKISEEAAEFSYDSIQIKTIAGTSKEEKDIAGKVEISASAKEITSITDGKKTITLDGGAAKLQADENTIYYVVINPQNDIDSLKMSFFKSGTKVDTATVVKSNGTEKFSINPGKILNAGTIKPRREAVFTIGDKKVKFSQGNLQATYHTATGKYTWGFAEHQWIGNMPGNATKGNQTDGAVVDLFGWTKAGLHNDGIKEYGINTSQLDADYGTGANDPCCDWGYAYCTSQGITPTNTWHLPTNAEWIYIFNSRTKSGGNVNNTARFAKAIVHSVNGLILIPDGYTKKDGNITKIEGIEINNVNTGGVGFNVNPISNENWDKLEAAGCAFLPTIDGNTGHYWSSTAHAPWNGSRACYVRFHGTAVTPSDYDDIYRWHTAFVRLISEVTVTVPATLSSGISSGSFSTE